MRHITKQPEFGRFIRAQRKAIGLSIRDMEKVSGVNKSMLSRIENGGDLRLSTIHRILLKLKHHIQILPDDV